MRESISDFLCMKALENSNFFTLSGDHGYQLFDQLRTVSPQQFINTGVNEQAMVGLAAGMAKTGKKIVIYGLASFVPMRVLEFIKMNICYENLPVTILGDGAGVVYSTLGASHQCGEDVACLRTLPIKIYSPADKREMELCLEEAFHNKTPSYIRIGKCDRPSIHSHDTLLRLTDLISIRESRSETCIFATGSMVYTGLKLSEKHSLPLYSCPILNFYDKNLFLQTISKFKKIISLEEHSVNGGLGSIIADLIATNNLNIKLIKIGIEKYFTKGCGSYEYAIKYHGLDLESIEKKINQELVHTSQQNSY